MEIPRTTEALTKLLRSKEISTREICEVVSQLDQLHLYFPNKENFILELIVDRWNDQKLSGYKKDHRIWKLFNELWMALGDEVILKRLLKKLRFVPHLIQTLQIVDSEFLVFLQTLKHTCSLINSLTTVEVSLDNANVIIGGALELLLKIPPSERDAEAAFEFMNEIETLVDVRNMAEVFARSTASYCSQLLLPSLKYFAEFKDSNDPIAALLTERLGSFVFGRSVDTVKLLDRFVQSKSTELSSQNCSALFSKCILFLSKEHFKELEKIFSILIRIHPELCSELLGELSLSKKTMSQGFLQGLFEDSISAIQRDTTNLELWQLIYYILTLDIEIGIKNSEQILALISKGRDQCIDWSIKLWSQLIKCHRNARELPQFFDKLESYCQQNSDSAFLINDDKFAEFLSDCLTTFSATQLKNELSEYLDVLQNSPANKLNAQLLIVLLKGLPKLAYATLADYRILLKRVFDLKLDDQKLCWTARYLVMGVFDDIIPEEILDSPEKLMETSNLSCKSPIELFYYLLKLREYRAFDMLPVIDPFMKKISSLPVEEQSGVLRIVFNNWSTIISSLFPQSEVKRLVDMVFTEDRIFILDDILNNDDVFEEQGIMHFIIRSVSQSYEDQSTLRFLLKVPIQCITKSIRIDLINKISQKADITETDMQVLVHLLKNATFRSDIEKDWYALQSFMVAKMKDLTYQNSVFETVWLNHLAQIKESVSEAFIQRGIESLYDQLRTEECDPACFQIAFLVLKSTTSDESQRLRSIYVEKAVKLFMDGTINKDLKMTSWLLRTLYQIFKAQGLHYCQEIPYKEALSRFIKSRFTGIQKTDNDLLISMFLLYSILYSTELEYLYAQYMVLRGAGIEATLLTAGIETAVRLSQEQDVKTFNRAFASTFESFESCPPDFANALLELYQLQIKLLDKGNNAAGKLFLRSVSDFYTHCSKFDPLVESISKIMNCIGELLISKAWLFSQYCIEMLFPLCLRLNLIFVDSTVDGYSDQIFITTMKVISNVLFTQRIKLSNRHHIVIAFLCENLELLSAYKDTKLTFESAKSLARLIINLCEPNSSLVKQASGRNILNSRTSEIKSSLRKHVPALLIRYIHLSVHSPFDPRARSQLTTAIYSIFDLLSQDGLSLVNSALDHAGRQYLRGLYADYKKYGKWLAD
ncbi:hypothetical protein HG536_0G03770 [Torulaspora globosa]|uniref:Nucleolar 27S pre-rRNA processing Urb2/Npa2 C-terminal domain-containing protein n=1 Tax=Torulaspora globosa TaxID=48254 RepID=A0A7G3ZLX9_9SACH|nr:uncharacterized protein HG536_0G03770 [Torulaspora globosa]QLL34515.1 hypothetical protein HG536_0G03770 [Torulaspora globosa]